MLYLFIGRDSFSQRKAVAELKEAIGPAESREANVSVLQGAGLTPGELLAACQAFPFLAERRLVLVDSLLGEYNERGRGPVAREGARRQPRDSSEWQETIEALKALPPSTDLVFVDEAVTPGNRLLALLRPIATLQQFDPPAPEQLRRWLAEEARKRHSSLAPNAVALLADLVGPDLWTLTNELEKLSLWATGRTITEEDVTSLVSATREVRIFTTVDAIVERNASLALRSLHALLQRGETSALQVLGMLARQVRLMLLTQELLRTGVPQQELGHRLGISGYPLQKTLEQARRYSGPQLVWFHDRLLQTDIAVKIGALDDQTAVEVLVAEVCTAPRRS